MPASEAGTDCVRRPVISGMPGRLRLEWGRNAFRPVTGPGTTGMRLMGGVAWSAAGSVAAQGASFLVSVVLARSLGKHVFGQFAIIQSTAVALGVISGMGLGATASKYVSQYRCTDPRRIGRILGLAAVVAFVAAVCSSITLFACAPLVSARSGGADAVVPGFRISILYVFFFAMNGYQTGALAGFEAFRAIAWNSAVYAVSNLTLTWLLAVRFGLNGAVLGQALGAVLLWSLYQVALHRQCRLHAVKISYRGSWQERKILCAFAIPAAACGIVASLGAWCVNLLMAGIGGFAQLAVFSAASNLRTMVLFLPALVARVSAPLLNGILASGARNEYRRTFWRTVALNGGISLALAVVIALAGARVLRIFGKDFAASGWLIALLMGSVVLEAIANSLYQALFTAGAIWHNLGIICAWALVLCALGRAFIPAYGASGLAFSYLAAWAVSAVLYGLAAVRQTRQGGPHVEA